MTVDFVENYYWHDIYVDNPKLFWAFHYHKAKDLNPKFSFKKKVKYASSYLTNEVQWSNLERAYVNLNEIIAVYEDNLYIKLSRINIIMLYVK